MYRSRQTEGPDDLEECFIKEERYQHQAETRAKWNAGENPPPFFRFNAPDAVRCSRPILLKDMPDYAPGTHSETANMAVLKAITASDGLTSADYLNLDGFNVKHGQHSWRLLSGEGARPLEAPKRPMPPHLRALHVLE